MHLMGTACHAWEWFSPQTNVGGWQVKAVLCAALYPNAAVMDEAAGRSARPAWNDGTADVHIHPSSINHPLEAHQFLRPYLVYLEKVSSSVTSSHVNHMLFRTQPFV